MNLSDLSIHTLSNMLNLSDKDLAHLSQQAPLLYNSYKIRKKSGKLRLIEAPHGNLKIIQKLLLDRLLSKLHADPILFGFKGSSTISALRDHTHMPLVLTMDIKDFFPSVKSYMVRKMILRHGAKNDLAVLLTRLVTRKNHLPQGAPTSPCVARLVLHHLVEHLKGAIRSTTDRARISIWVDDVTFSGPIGLKRLKKTLISIFNRNGFIIPENKVKIMPNNIEQESLGIRLNEGIGVTSSYIQKYKDECKRLGASSRRCRGMLARIKYLQAVNQLSPNGNLK